MKRPYYPDIKAVDPYNCGCTECIIGEYVNEDVWRENATPADVVALMKGDVRNNTYDTLYGLVFDSSYDDHDTREFIRELKESMVEVFAIYGDIESIAENHNLYS